ncbi:MAG: disulfide bond formation protein B [Candidatus Liptonbacteria bacterium]|nr:disulfide bond formation protein B [Candidatus Liptonbacteria bacterium]
MLPFVQTFTDVLSFTVLLGGIFGVFLIIFLVSPFRQSREGRRIADFLAERAILFSFIISFAGVASSLFYSEIAGFEPCVLCWWQRIFLYPQAVILFVALLKKDFGVRKYALALSGIGFLIALYHTYIQFGGESLAFCPAGSVSCQILYFVEYGYVTIPTMALTAFGLIILLSLFLKREVRE